MTKKVDGREKIDGAARADRRKEAIQISAYHRKNVGIGGEMKHAKT